VRTSTYTCCESCCVLLLILENYDVQVGFAEGVHASLPPATILWTTNVFAFVFLLVPIGDTGTAWMTWSVVAALVHT